MCVFDGLTCGMVINTTTQEVSVGNSHTVKRAVDLRKQQDEKRAHHSRDSSGLGKGLAYTAAFSVKYDNYCSRAVPR